MAAYRSGALDGLPSINECLASPALSERLGCQSPRQYKASDGQIKNFAVCAAEGQGIEVQFMRHPELFITESIKNWYKSYSYVEKFGVNLPYNEQHNCWIECWETFEHYLRIFKNV